MSVRQRISLVVTFDREPDAAEMADMTGRLADMLREDYGPHTHGAQGYKGPFVLTAGVASDGEPVDPLAAETCSDCGCHLCGPVTHPDCTGECDCHDFASPDPPAHEKAAPVVDLMDALEASIKAAKAAPDPTVDATPPPG